jgi:tetratricopeptide (TPR) repeat protein
MSIQRNKDKISVPSFIFALFSLVILCFPRTLPQTQPERIVSIKIASDRDLNNLDTLRMDVRKLISDSCRDFKRDFGIVHKIEEFVYWTPTTNATSMKFYLNDLRKKVRKGGNDIVIGIISNSRTEDSTAGLASYLTGYIILKNFKSKIAMTSVLKHELCHMYGAVDIHENDSIMNFESLGCEFDEFTTHIIMLNKHRRFDPNAYPLPISFRDRAINIYKKRAALNPGEPELHLVLAFLYLEKQELNEALLQYQKALEMKPELIGIQILIGNIRLKMGEPERALNAYIKASSLFPQLPEVQFNMGLAYTQMGMIEEALSAYDKTIELAPNYFGAHVNLGYLYLKTNNPDYAAESSRKALDLIPDSPEALTTLGAALLSQTKHCPPIGPDKATQADFTNRKNAAPMDNGQKKKLIKEAIERCQHAISLKPALPQSHNILGVALAYSGNNTSAEAEFKEACRLRPDYLEAHFNLGVLYLLNHRLAESVDCFNRALAIDPDFALGYQKLTEVYHTLFLEYKKEAERRGLKWEKALIADFLFSGIRPDH